ncbi:MAG: hypothetical protein FJ125_14440, partial [Deltaproteobacteria bacterium]|nr:hypothetical protein [Deltaproteobacteria bacterium]
MTPPERQFHPAASIFPLLERYPLAELAEDIRRSGLREPIVLHPDGSILDGRNRYLACLKVGVEPRFRTWDDQGSQGSAVAFVVSCNLHRRHLTESQRAMVAARIATLEAHRPAAGSTAIAAVPQPEAAQMLNVSVDSVQRARQVQQHAAPELVQAVERGQVAVSTAAIVAAAVPPAEQAELIVRGEAEILARAKEIRAQHRAQRRQDDYYPTPPWLIRALLRYIED